MTAPRDTRSALLALLDALEANLLGARAQEVQAALREAGRAREGAVQELRSLLRDAEAGGEGRCPPALSPGKAGGLNVQRH